ncbi:hypothetical protein BDZ85DRAFT_50106 [Elsinoe ampelina]|uniref:Uncharacterized protein n=1 Tax=Elsinoe ampelina TaxID=302913 RepID=A0A6A6GLJ4_9PEZI|nr:hypothetical protein BDZ85DRAFT_50106 [Elsinoe ampelina]
MSDMATSPKVYHDPIPLALHTHLHQRFLTRELRLTLRTTSGSLFVATAPKGHRGPMFLRPSKDRSSAPVAIALRNPYYTAMQIPDPSGIVHSIHVHKEAHNWSGRHKYSFSVPGIAGTFQWQKRAQRLVWVRNNSTQETLLIRKWSRLFGSSSYSDIEFAGQMQSDSLGLVWRMAAIMSLVCVLLTMARRSTAVRNTFSVQATPVC